MVLEVKIAPRPHKLPQNIWLFFPYSMDDCRGPSLWGE